MQSHQCCITRELSHILPPNAHITSTVMYARKRDFLGGQRIEERKGGQRAQAEP